MTEKPAQTAGGGRLSARWQHLQARDKASGYLQARSQLLKLECQWRWTEACLPASVRQLLLGDQRLIQILLERKSVELLLRTLEQRETDPHRRRELLKELCDWQTRLAGNELPTPSPSRHYRSSSSGQVTLSPPSSQQPMRSSSTIELPQHTGSPSGSEPPIFRLSLSPSEGDLQPRLRQYGPVVSEIEDLAECWGNQKLIDLFKELGMPVGETQKIRFAHPGLKDSGKYLMEKWLSCQFRKRVNKPMTRLLEAMRKIGMGGTAERIEGTIEEHDLMDRAAEVGATP